MYSLPCQKVFIKTHFRTDNMLIQFKNAQYWQLRKYLNTTTSCFDTLHILNISLHSFLNPRLSHFKVFFSHTMKQCIFNFCLRTPGLCGCLRKVAPLFQFALCFTPYSLISPHSLIASFRPLEIAFNYSCLFSTNTLEMELANKQCQATLILVYSKDPLMH